MSKKIIIIGGGRHAQVIRSIMAINDDFECLGYTDVETRNLNIPYLGDDSCIKNYSPKEILLINGIGSVDLPSKRQCLYERFKKLGYTFHSMIHPRAVISSEVELAEGVQIMAGVVINCGTIIEENVVLNTSSSIDHDCQIGAHSHIAPGVTLSGQVTIGEGCHIGTGATVIQGIHVGNHSLVGAGSVVISDIGSNSKVLGNPARMVLA